MTSVVCRPALVSEQKVLEALQRRASLANPGDRDALLTHPEAIDLPPVHLAGGHVFAAELTGSIVGFAAVLPRQDGNAELDALFVEPDLWRRGIGRALVEHCAAVARTRGARALHVVGNPHAADFYRTCGFEPLGVTQTRFGPGLLLHRPLA